MEKRKEKKKILKYRNKSEQDIRNTSTFSQQDGGNEWQRGKKESKQVCGKASNPVCLTDRRGDTWINLKAKEERENDGEQGRMCANIT